MAKKIKVKRGKAGGKPLLDAAMAALAAVSVGFVTFAMPNDIFSGLVTSSGIPALVPAAQPPLGQTARLAAVALAAILTFAAVFGLLRALGRAPAKGKTRGKPVEVSGEPPRLRRADSHPDAPSRRPIFAGADLGAPLPPTEVDFTEYEPTESEDAEWERPVPEFLEAAEEAPEATPADLPVEEETLELEQPEESFQAPVEEVAEEPAPEVEEVDAAEEPTGWVDDYVPPQPVVQEEYEPAAKVEEKPFAGFEDEEPFAGFEDEEPSETEEAPVADTDEVHEIHSSKADEEEQPIDLGALARRLPENPEASDVPIPSLIQRLEVGLIRREHASDEGQEPSESQEALDQRLRSAIGDLRRMARNS